MIQLSPPPFKTDAIPKFEKMIAKATGTKYALATSSGTAAIHLALLALGVGPGDRVLCPTFTFAATANPILYCGATPVFIGCNESMSMDVTAVLKAVTVRRAKAVIVAPLYGNCDGHASLREVCMWHGIPLIEDAAEALGATYYRERAGSFGDVGCVSFNLNKIVTAGGGGALVSDKLEVIEKARFLANQAKDPVPWYEHSQIGYNYRIAAHCARYGVQQLGKLAERVKERRAVNALYREYLPDDFFLSTAGEPTHWLTVGVCSEPAVAIDALAEQGIEARRMWKPLHTQPVFSHLSYYGDRMADSLFEHGICLPSRGVSRRDVRKICGILEAYL